MSTELKFKISKEDVTKQLKKNTKAKTEKDMQRSIALFDSALEKITSFSITNELEKFKEEMIGKINAQEEIILKNSHNREKIESELVYYMSKLIELVEKGISEKEGFYINHNTFYSESMSFSSSQAYYSSGSFNISFYSRRKVVFVFSIPVVKGKMNLHDTSKMKIYSKDANKKGINDVLNNNTEQFFEVIKKLDLAEMYKMNLVLSSFHYLNNFQNNRTSQLIQFEEMSNKNKFKSFSSLIRELESFKDVVEISNDIKLNIITKEEIEELAQ